MNSNGVNPRLFLLWQAGDELSFAYAKSVESKKNLKNNTSPKICVNNDICPTLSHSSLSYTKYYDFINCYWQTCGFQKVLKVFVFLTGERVENPDNKKKTWNKVENQQQTPPIWMLIWTDLFEPTAQFPCPQIQWEWLLGYVSSVSS